MRNNGLFSWSLATIALISTFLLFEFGLFPGSILFVVSVIVIAFFLTPRLGVVLGGAVSFLLQAVTVLFAGIVGGLLVMPYSQSFGIALLLSALTVAITSIRKNQGAGLERKGWGKAHWAALVGPLFFSLSFAASKVFPGGNLYAWAMNNDAVNNILMVRDLVKDGGITLGDGGNPVPFTTSMLSLFLASPQVDYSAHGNLLHDVIGLESFWFLTAVLLGLSAGLLAAELLTRNTKSKKWGIAAAAITSLATNMWFIIGYPIEYGFLNAALGLALLIVAVLVFMFFREHPAQVLGALFLASILILATWTPTILFLISFVIVIVITQHKKIFVKNFGILCTWLVPLLLAILFFGVVTIPSFIRTSSLLSAQGGVEHFPIVLLWFMPTAIIVFSFLAFGVKSSTGWAFSAIGLAQLTAVGALLFLNRTLEDPWAYYPFKMLWFGSAFIALLTIPLMLIAVSRLRSKSLRIGSAVLFTLGILLCLNWSVPKPSTFMFKGTSGIFFSQQGELFNDEVAQQMFKDDQEGLVVYWVSHRGDQASALNFWNISNWANSLKPHVYDLRYLAYYLPPEDPALLCELSELSQTTLTVVTAIEELDQEIAILCPDAKMIFREQ